MLKTMKAAALFGGLAVALGAFGAHGLKSLIGLEQVATFVTGVRYQFYHALALGLAAAVWDSPRVSVRQLGRAAWCWVLGVLLFSGSLYLLSLREVHGLAVGFLGPVTPIGGLLLLSGWVFLFLSVQSSHQADA